ncbi:MAG: TonB-dependent receptor, partial [Bryobacteraceae bacterium]|nr:TonB-dependent receptor [Bryobacteraceae bacterium]
SPWESGDGTNAALSHTVVANFTKLVRTHNLRFGADLRVYRGFGNRFPQAVSPDLAFSNLWTKGPVDNSPAAPVGQELASMLFGIPNGSMQLAASYAIQSRYLGFYIHDDFKLTRKLTLNLGLRYEKETPLTERYDRMVGGFAENEPSPIEAQARANYARSPIPELPLDQFRVRGGLRFVNSGGLGRNQFQTESNNFLPRVGFSWEVGPKTVVRAGIGLFYDLVGVNRSEALQAGFSQSTPIQPSLDSGLTFIATNANPLPSGLLQPLGAAGGLSTNLGQGIEFYPAKRLNGYASRWSFGLQHQLGEYLLEASYVGNRGTRLAMDRSLNETPAQYLSRSPVRDQATIDYLSAQFANPLRGTNPIYGANTSRAALLRPYPQFGGISMQEPIGYSWFHSMQARVEKRFSKGYTFGLSYTLSKAMEAVSLINAVDTVPYESLGGLDRPHRIAVSGIYEFPFGKGRQFGAGMPAPLEFLAGGWQLNAVIIYQSGNALGFGNALFAGNIADIALDSSQRNADRWFNTEAGFNRVPAQQLASNYRLFPLRFGGVRGDSQHRWDLSAIKNFRIVERARAQFRAECFNALNHSIFNDPNTAPTNTAFGRITGTQAQARTFQLALKLEF